MNENASALMNRCVLILICVAYSNPGAFSTRHISGGSSLAFSVFNRSISFSLFFRPSHRNGSCSRFIRFATAPFFVSGRLESCPHSPVGCAWTRISLDTTAGWPHSAGVCKLNLRITLDTTWTSAHTGEYIDFFARSQLPSEATSSLRKNANKSPLSPDHCLCSAAR